MIRALLFDWGNTVMVDDGATAGPMCDWPNVTACPYVRDTLSILHSRYFIAIATNADDSFEKEIARALERVDLHRYIDRIYCSNRIGQKKPAQAFFAHIVEDLMLPPEEVVMIGDSLEKDVYGARSAGIRAVWYAPGGSGGAVPAGIGYFRDHRELPKVIESLERMPT